MEDEPTYTSISFRPERTIVWVWGSYFSSRDTQVFKARRVQEGNV